MIIIGITGTLGAGKGTIVEYLKEKHHFIHFSVRDFLREEAVRRGFVEINRDTFTEVANDLRAQHGGSFIIDKLYEKAAEKGQNAIIESIRNVQEIRTLREKEHFFLLAVDADPKVRYSRILLRKSETDNISFETFLANERRELTSTEANKQNLSACIKEADAVFQNNGDLAELFQQIDNFMQKMSQKC